MKVDRPSTEAAASVEAPLATPEQLELDRLALRLWRSAPVRDAVARAHELYLADPRAQTASGRGSALEAAESIAFAAVQQGILSDPSRPVLMWTASGPRRWFGLDVPGSGYGIDNPDNVHRRAAIDGVSSYVIRGRVPADGPTQQSIILYEAAEGTGPVAREGNPIAGFLVSDQRDVEPDGSFEVTLDPTPAEGRRNHVQTTPGCSWMVVRDALGDWATQRPTTLSIERVSGPDAPPAAGEEQLADLAASTLDRIARYWLAYNNELIYPRPGNWFKEPAPRPFGRSCVGWFELGDDESLVVTLDALGAAYVGFDVTDPWGVTRPHVHATGSLNNRQARANADGTLTYVVGPEDPGVHNWADTSGLTAGMVALRWQGGTLAERAAIHQVRVLPTRQVRAEVDAGLWLDEGGRAEQLRRRAADYYRRVGVPAPRRQPA